jgi:exodeoxyribonuclease VII small subunit
VVSAKDPAKEESFEALLSKLESVVKKLEAGELPLDESLKAYEEGIALVRAAQGRLDGMDKRLEQLLADGRTAPMKAPAENGDEG